MFLESEFIFVSIQRVLWGAQVAVVDGEFNCGEGSVEGFKSSEANARGENISFVEVVKKVYTTKVLYVMTVELVLQRFLFRHQNLCLFLLDFDDIYHDCIVCEIFNFGINKNRNMLIH